MRFSLLRAQICSHSKPVLAVRRPLRGQLALLKSHLGALLASSDTDLLT